MVLILYKTKNISDKCIKMNIHMKLTLLVVEAVVTGQEQHKQIPGKLFSECVHLISNPEIKHKRVIKQTFCITPLK